MQKYNYSFFNLDARLGGCLAPRPGRITPRETDTIPIVQKAGWAPGSVRTGAENLAPTGIRYPDCPYRGESLYRLSYRDPPYVTVFKLIRKSNFA